MAALVDHERSRRYVWPERTFEWEPSFEAEGCDGDGQCATLEAEEGPSLTEADVAELSKVFFDFA
jgi:hypothetical protein